MLGVEALRAWCFDTSSTTYVYPPDIQGTPIVVPSLLTPKVVFAPSTGWHGARHSVQPFCLGARLQKSS